MGEALSGGDNQGIDLRALAVLPKVDLGPRVVNTLIAFIEVRVWEEGKFTQQNV